MGLRVAVFVSLVGLATPADAATLRVPRDHPTIQAAVDAAADGDTIVVSRGTYAEAVVVNARVGLTLKGRGHPTIDGQNAVVPLTVSSSSDITITGFTVERSSDVGILLEFTTDSVVSRCTVRDSAGDGIRELGGLETRVERNRVEGAGDDCIELFTNAGSAIRNRLEGCAQAGVRVNGGSGHEVTGNRIDAPVVDGVHVVAALTTVERNKVANATGAGIRVSGGASEANLIRRNKVADTVGSGIVLEAGVRGNAVLRNKVAAPGGHGVQVDPDSFYHQLEANRVLRAGLDGFHLESPANLLIANRADGSGGFDLSDAAMLNLYRDNRFGTVAP